MDRERFYKLMNGEGILDYEVYLSTKQLLTAQKPFEELCNQDELLFQIVHQVEELWMKSIAYSLLDIDDYLSQRKTARVLTHFDRVHRLVRLMTAQLSVLETLSPKDYQEIRLQLGNGSGQESPGFNTLLKMPKHLWETYQRVYLEEQNLTLEQVYDTDYDHGEAYVAAEALAEFDALFQKFRYHHLQLIQRTIGLDSKSLKGRPIELLEKGAKARFYPALWAIRSTMTNQWGGTYGEIRDSIEPPPSGCPFSHAEEDVPAEPLSGPPPKRNP